MEKLSDIIHQYKTAQVFDFQLVLSKMTPLLKKYSNKFPFYYREDAYQEFCIAIFECLNRIQDYSSEQQCLTYLKKAILFKYIYLKKSYIDNVETQDIDTLINCPDKHSDIDASIQIRQLLREYYSSLSEYKREILIYILKGYSCADISKKLNVSRQYINTIRNHFRNDLKKIL